MYIGQQPGEMSFAEQQMRGMSGGGLGTITASQLGAITASQLGAAGDATTAVMPAPAPAPAPAPPVTMPAVAREQDKQSTMAYVVGGLAVLGLAFVIYKVTKD